MTELREVDESRGRGRKRVALVASRRIPARERFVVFDTAICAVDCYGAVISTHCNNAAKAWVICGWWWTRCATRLQMNRT